MLLLAVIVLVPGVFVGVTSSAGGVVGRWWTHKLMHAIEANQPTTTTTAAP